MASILRRLLRTANPPKHRRIRGRDPQAKAWLLAQRAHAERMAAAAKDAPKG